MKLEKIDRKLRNALKIRKKLNLPAVLPMWLKKNTFLHIFSICTSLLCSFSMINIMKMTKPRNLSILQVKIFMTYLSISNYLWLFMNILFAFHLIDIFSIISTTIKYLSLLGHFASFFLIKWSKSDQVK